ncbi:MAG TPA: RbsD/FucU domain-containing protein [Casimicrobiaceae bacterium]|nr:RbsD/FucU domain-containing protein [Casimicrobiaceae bacterium]
MLKGLSPLLTPDLLHALASMGHGDEVAIVDANFPSASLARRIVTIAGAGAHEVLAAVLDVLPLDGAASPAAFTMEVAGDAEALPETVADFAAVLADHGHGDLEIGHLERQAFYARAQDAFAIVRTGELRAYGNILLVKGTVNAVS